MLGRLRVSMFGNRHSVVDGVSKMPCFKPLKAIKDSGGVRVLGGLSFSGLHNLLLPCGQCIGCRLERSRQWAVRIMHEAKFHDQNSFLTLTYDEEHLPHDLSLNYRHFQMFMKRLRKKLNKPLRFYMCGEYGETFARPHYHVCLFGHDFTFDRKIHSKSSSGFLNYVSDTLNSVWGYGFCVIGDLTFESAAYTARYVVDKVNGDLADDHYKLVDSSTGEIFWRVPEFAHMSLKPGIGARWFDKYQTDVFPHDRVVINGKAAKPPRYYDRRFNKINPEAFDDVKQKRFEQSMKHIDDNKPSRLAVREVCAKARLSFKSRSI